MATEGTRAGAKPKEPEGQERERASRSAGSGPDGEWSRDLLVDHNSPSQPKENSIGQNHHQEEIIRKLAVQLKNIGDSIDHRLVQEDLLREGRDALAHFVLVFFGGGHLLLRFLWNNHLM